MVLCASPCRDIEWQDASDATAGLKRNPAEEEGSQEHGQQATPAPIFIVWHSPRSSAVIFIIR